MQSYSQYTVATMSPREACMLVENILWKVQKHDIHQTMVKDFHVGVVRSKVISR
jgi:hypothetical protein